MQLSRPSLLPIEVASLHYGEKQFVVLLELTGRTKINIYWLNCGLVTLKIVGRFNLQLLFVVVISILYLVSSASVSTGFAIITALEEML